MHAFLFGKHSFLKNKKDLSSLFNRNLIEIEKKQSAQTMANKQKEPLLVDESRGGGDNLEATENFNFANEEENILKMWTEIDAFRTQLKLSQDRKRYTFYDGPPFATGLPHYGHILAGTIKDTVTR